MQFVERFDSGFVLHWQLVCMDLRYFSGTSFLDVQLDIDFVGSLVELARRVW